MRRLHAPLLPLALCLIVGIIIGCWLGHWHITLFAGGFVVAVSLLLGKWPRCQTAGIMISMLLLGMTLGGRQQQKIIVLWPKDPVKLQVVVMNEPTVRERMLIVDVLTAEHHRKLRLRFSRNERSEQIAIGQGLLINTRICSIKEWQRGHFSLLRFIQSHGYCGEGFVRSNEWRWHAVPLSGLSVLERVRLRALLWRHHLLQRFRQWGMEADTYGVLAAMALGDKTTLSRDIRMVYSKVGASHILALSGVHLMIIYGMVTMILGWRRIRTFAQIVTILAMWAFALLVGLSPSVARSASMITVYALLSLGYRERMSVNVLAFVAIVMLIINPLSLYDVGFQLSFMAVLCILLFHPLLQQFIPLHIQMEHRWLRWLWGLTTLSVSAQVGTAPLVAYYFGQLPTYFLLTNYVVIPLASVTLYLAFGLLAFSFWPLAASILAWSLNAVVLSMNRFLSGIAALPACSIEGLTPTGMQVLLIYVVIGCCYVLLSLRSPVSLKNV